MTTTDEEVAGVLMADFVTAAKETPVQRGAAPGTRGEPPGRPRSGAARFRQRLRARFARCGRRCKWRSASRELRDALDVRRIRKQIERLDRAEIVAAVDDLSDV